MRFSIFIFLFALLASCGEVNPTTEKNNDIRSENGLPPKDTTPIPAAPAISTSNPKPIDAAWNDYWKKFRQAVANDGRAMMFSLVKFPFPGANLLSTQVYADKCDQDDFRIAYFEIFDELTKRAVSDKSAIEVDFYSLVGDEYKGSRAEEIGIAEGTKIYKFQVGKLIKTSSGGNALGFDNFHFGKFDGTYKLAWISIERPE